MVVYVEPVIESRHAPGVVCEPKEGQEQRHRVRAVAPGYPHTFDEPDPLEDHDNAESAEDPPLVLVDQTQQFLRVVHQLASVANAAVTLASVLFTNKSFSRLSSG